METRDYCVTYLDGRVRGSFFYPCGGAVGDFYEALAENCRAWLEDEYSEYAGRGIVYRFFADCTEGEDASATVSLTVSLREKGRGTLGENRLDLRWESGGELLFERHFFDKKMTNTP